jgi:hypothetical protein
MALPFDTLWLFPNLVAGEYEKESDRTDEYNCIAWVKRDKARQWWPFPHYYWPPDAPYEESLAAFIATFRLQGYEVCESAELEEEFEKVAIYVDADGTPAHAALQKPNGVWSSKLGDLEDIDHNLHGLERTAQRPAYGTVTTILRRPRHG